MVDLIHAKLDSERGLRREVMIKKLLRLIGAICGFILFGGLAVRSLVFMSSFDGPLLDSLGSAEGTLGHIGAAICGAIALAFLYELKRLWSKRHTAKGRKTEH